MTGIICRQKVKWQRSLEKNALNAGATKSSGKAFEEMKSNPSNSAKTSKAKKIRKISQMNQYVRSGFSNTVLEYSDRIAHDQAKNFWLQLP